MRADLCCRSASFKSVTAANDERVRDAIGTSQSSGERYGACIGGLAQRDRILIERLERGTGPATIHLLQCESRRQRNAYLALGKWKVFSAQFEQAAANGISLSQKMDFMVEIIVGIGLRNEANRRAAQRQGLLQMRQQMPDQQVLFSGDGETYGKNFNRVEAELSRNFGQRGVVFLGIIEVTAECGKEGSPALNAAGRDRLQTHLDGVVQGVARVRKFRQPGEDEREGVELIFNDCFACPIQHGCHPGSRSR